MSANEASLIALLAEHPAGMTTVQVAQAIGLNPDGTSSRLSKLKMYGLISGRKAVNRDRPGHVMLWLPKPKATS